MIANIYGSIARISVPLFFMMSGYLLLPRTESLRSFYTKRMPKVVLPFIFWSVIYLTVFCGGQPATCTSGFLWQYITSSGLISPVVPILTDQYLFHPACAAPHDPTRNR